MSFFPQIKDFIRANQRLLEKVLTFKDSKEIVALFKDLSLIDYVEERELKSLEEIYKMVLIVYAHKDSWDKLLKDLKLERRIQNCPHFLLSGIPIEQQLDELGY